MLPSLDRSTNVELSAVSKPTRMRMPRLDLTNTRGASKLETQSVLQSEQLSSIAAQEGKALSSVDNATLNSPESDRRLQIPRHGVFTVSKVQKTPMLNLAMSSIKTSPLKAMQTPRVMPQVLRPQQYALSKVLMPLMSGKQLEHAN